MRKGRGTPLSRLSILSLGLFCCYILMGFGSFFLFSLIALVVLFKRERKKKENDNSQFRGKKETTHTGKNHQTPAQRCTHLFIWVSLPAGTELTQLSLKSGHGTAGEVPTGRTGERGRNGGPRGQGRGKAT